ncbi:MAG: thiamine-phosphate kinase [Hyphomicrobiaceae bacterium]
MAASGEERFIAQYLAPLAAAHPGAYGLTDDCAELAPLPGHALIFKTDPIVEGVHFLSDDAPEDLAWKALAVNVSDLAAKAARPVAYLMALTLPEKPEAAWMARFAQGLEAAQTAFGCVLIGGDTDRSAGPLSIAVTAIGEVRAGQMVPRGGARAGDAVYVSGALGGAALGLRLRIEADAAAGWPLGAADRAAALARYLRPQPRLGLRTALRGHARAAMDISDGLLKDLDRMCRLASVGARIELAALPLAHGVKAVMNVDQAAAIRLATAGDDYEVLATVAPESAAAFEASARRGGVAVARIGHVVTDSGVRLVDAAGGEIDAGTTGYDHFDAN